MADRAGRDQQRNHQNERVKIKAPPANPAQTPYGLDGCANQRDEHPVGPPKIDNQREKDHYSGEGEDQEQLAGEKPDPAFERRLTSDVHVRVVVFYLTPDARDLALNLPVIQPVFVKSGENERGFAVL